MPIVLQKEPKPFATKAFVAGAITAALLVVFGVASICFGSGCDFTGLMTNETLVKQMTAPDGKHTAVIVERGGDATVGFFRMVALCDGSGGCAAKKENIVASNRAQGVFNLGWQGNDKLLIYSSPFQPTFLTTDKKDGVKIEFAP